MSLQYFILGCLFILVILPVIENLLSVMAAWSEYMVYVFVLKITYIKKQCADLDSDDDGEEQEKNHPFGFCTEAIGIPLPTSDQEEDIQ